MLQNLGRIGFVFEGPWVSGKNYKKLSVVSYQNRLYSSIGEVEGQPGVDPSWILMMDDPISYSGYRVRKIVSSNMTLYVREGGDDSNDGLTEGTAFSTIQAAFDYVSNNLSVGGYTVTIDVGPGTFSTCRLSYYEVGAGFILLKGAGKDQTIISGNNTRGVLRTYRGENILYVEDLTVQLNITAASTTSARAVIMADQGSTINLNGVRVVLNENVYTSHRIHLLYGYDGGLVNILSGGAELVANGLPTSRIDVCDASGVTGLINIGGPLNIQGQGRTFMYLHACASVFGSVAITGAFTGRRYMLNNKSYANTYGAGSDYFPGTTEGSMQDDCIYS